MRFRLLDPLDYAVSRYQISYSTAQRFACWLVLFVNSKPNAEAGVCMILKQASNSTETPSSWLKRKKKFSLLAGRKSIDNAVHSRTSSTTSKPERLWAEAAQVGVRRSLNRSPQSSAISLRFYSALSIVGAIYKVTFFVLLGKIGLFYFVYYGFLTAFFAACLTVFLSTLNEPGKGGPKTNQFLHGDSAPGQ